MSRRVLAPLPRGSPAPEVALLSSAVPSRPGVFQVSPPLLRSAEVCCRRRCRPCGPRFFLSRLPLFSTAYSLDCYADGFLRSNFYIYLRRFKLWDFVFVFVVGHLSIFSHQFCSLLAMDKIGSFWPIKKISL